ncbi:MAG: sugar ABC transporter ATP-binding protein [Spirochaetes bacterium GWD1_27_9]|nr:MAG: sugar ABC transporter ATP-binding protein [Spirochaetes bacterium GWB1_27_13]OHD27866.1 MAG: sugar ABC transporter ATP-binding protein [Spirochaetes bacterium GWC1_27_15]OHD30874.1 MAG: sugar ABC transporter ATP-binding protein [Spirochaetes bacterium GWD1_27_9]
MQTIIKFDNVKKHYKVKEKIEGKFSALKTFFSNKFSIVKAVENISFEIKEGEFIGYIGPNGAGKSTTIKLLTGILVPTEGNVEVTGLIPYKNRAKYVLNIGAVFGQRTQIWWDLPVSDSYELNKKLYNISDSTYKENLTLIKDTLGVGDFYNKPVRQLSLGQKMRAEIGASLLHNPKILFLDEPTIGLDVVAKDKIRKFLKFINQEKKTTILLTTHDMVDLEKLCERIIIIDLGKVIFDGKIDEIKNAYQKKRIIIVDFEEENINLELENATLIKDEKRRKYIEFDKDLISPKEILNQIVNKYQVKDITIEDVEIEKIIQEIYESKQVIRG